MEIRQPNLLRAEYFSMLASHGVSHIFNSWAGMPPMEEQMAMPGSLTRPAVTGARLLLKPGRKYQEAVDTFQPYTAIREPRPEVRAAAAGLIRGSLDRGPGSLCCLYINNRLEGNAPGTILEILRLTDGNDGQ